MSVGVVCEALFHGRWVDLCALEKRVPSRNCIANSGAVAMFLVEVVFFTFNKRNAHLEKPQIFDAAEL